MNTLFAILLSIVPADTATIGGNSDPTAIEDALIFENTGLVVNNYGANTTRLMGRIAGQDLNVVHRINDVSDIPSGTITAVTEYLYRISHPSIAQAAGTINVYTMAASNDADWVVGTSDGSTEAGACSGEYAVRTSNVWANGDGKPSIDAVSVGSYAFGSVGAGVADPGWESFSWSTITIWEQWRDATRTNGGWWTTIDTRAANRYFYANSSDSGSNESYVVVTYEAGGPSLQPGMTLFE